MAASAPDVKVQDPGTRQDDTFQSSKDNLTLYLFRYLPSKAATEAPRAHVIFSQYVVLGRLQSIACTSLPISFFRITFSGFIEHTGRYHHLFPLFAQSNISVTGYDLRGYGQTWAKHATPKKAHGNTSWKQQFEDLEDLIRLERKRLDDAYGKDKVPIFLMGHSMVGASPATFLVDLC